MATKNPFGQLNIRRDDDDEVERKPAQVQVAQAPAQEHKKKVRPEERKPQEQHQDNDTEGFSEVKKSKVAARPKPAIEESHDTKKEKHIKNKGAFNPKNDKVAPGKRQFERQSGTGRGKEIAKNGAGGKHTWGTNPKNIAREKDDFNYYDDDRKY